MLRRTKVGILVMAGGVGALAVTGIAIATTSTTTTPVTFCVGAKGALTYAASGTCPARTTTVRVGSAGDVQALASRLDTVESSMSTARQCPSGEYVTGIGATGGLVCSTLPSPSPSPTASSAAPAQVTGLSAATVSTTQLQLSWTYPAGPTLAQVIVRRAAGTVAPATPTAGVEITAPAPGAAGTVEQITDAGLSQGTTYSYAVFSRDADGHTSAAATVTGATTPGAVEGLTASPIEGPGVRLTWTYPSGDPLAQLVVRRAEGAVAPATPADGVGVATQTPSAAGALGQLDDSGLAPATTYSYSVFSQDAYGHTSAAATATTTTS